MTDDQLRRIERLENRLNEAERELASLKSELRLMQEDLSRRIVEIKSDLRGDIHGTRTDMKDIIDTLRQDIKNDMDNLSVTVGTVNTSVSQITDAIQTLYVSQNTAQVKVNTNERIIWGVVSVACAAALYFLQTFLSKGG